jgi:hypothetical protein
MKPVQWIIAVVVLVAVVFAATFYMSFFGTSGPTTQPPPPNGESILVFSETTFPQAYPGYYAQEQNQTGGYHDYLFINPTDDDVTFGLNSKNCTCTSAGIYIATSEWKESAAMALAGDVGGTGLNPLLSAGFLTAVEAAKQDAATKVEPLVRWDAEKDMQSTCTIPARALGWLRLAWRGDKTDMASLTVEAWMKQKQKTQGIIKLEAKLRYCPPAFISQSTINVGDLTLEDLQTKPKDVEIIVYSSTRTELHPKATLLTKGKPEESPIVIDDKVERIPPPYERVQQRLMVERADPQAPPERVVSAYRVVVHLRERSPDEKRAFPFGSFRARLRVTFDDEKIDPLPCYIYGKMRGDIRLAGEGRIDFGHFTATAGSRPETVTIYSDVPGLKLEIDKERTWVKLRDTCQLIETKPNEWKLTARIKPDAMYGNFPREDDDELFDTAIYVKEAGDALRSLRVPTGGSAD